MKKWPFLLIVPCLGLLGQNGQVQHKRFTVTIQGTAMEFDFQKPTGAAQILITKGGKTLTISADAMTFHEDTGEIEAQGNVRMKFTR
jgi:hypothetical protein